MDTSGLKCMGSIKFSLFKVISDGKSKSNKSPRFCKSLLKLLLKLTHKQTKEWVDQTSIEYLLNALSSTKWKPLRKKVYKVFSRRARKMFADDLENYPVISDKQINMAQRILTYNALQVKPATRFEKFIDKIMLYG